MKIPKKKILEDASSAYNEKIKPLISLDEFDHKNIFRIVRQSTYQITGNEDILCEEKYDNELQKLLNNFNDVFDKMRDKSGQGIIQLFQEINDSGIDGNQISEEDKKYFLKVFKNNKNKLRIINMVLATIFVAVCLKSAGYKIKF